MAAFDKVKSGFGQMDDILDYIRMGDNVVWQVSDIDEFRFFAVSFVEQAKKDGRDILYIRFAQHPPIPDDLTGVKMVAFDPDAGFETFTVAIHDEITRAGRDAFYVFDCLSELQSVWYTDLMMGNFFRVTCPYLFELDTVAYFPELRGRHSFDAIARIRETTQLLLDVCSNEKWVYLHPLKVWRRNSDTMFMPHGYRRSTGEFQLIDNGVSISRYYQTIQEIREKHQDQNIDSHDRLPTSTARRSRCTPPWRRSTASPSASSTRWTARRTATARWRWKGCSPTCRCGTSARSWSTTTRPRTCFGR